MPPADGPKARTAQHHHSYSPWLVDVRWWRKPATSAVPAAALLVLGLVDVSAWGLVMRYRYHLAAAPVVARAWEALAVLLTLAALVWVTRLFIRAVRSSPRARTTIVAVTAVGVLGLALWYTLKPPSPDAQVRAMAAALQPCVRATNRTAAIFDSQRAVIRSGAFEALEVNPHSPFARALSDQAAACTTALRQLYAVPGFDPATQDPYAQDPYWLERLDLDAQTTAHYARALVGDWRWAATDYGIMPSGHEDDRSRYEQAVLHSGQLLRAQ
jgi:hypothetical protein